MQIGLVLRVHNAQVARQSKLGLIVAKRIRNELRLRLRQRSLRLHNRQIVIHAGGKSVVRIGQRMRRQVHVLLRDAHQRL